MAASFDVNVDTSRDLVRLTLHGFFAPADVVAFEAERDRGHARLTCAPNAHLTLADVRGMTVQPQDVVKTFGGLLANPKHQSRKLALVFASALAKRQLARGRRAARRILHRPG